MFIFVVYVVKYFPGMMQPRIIVFIYVNLANLSFFYYTYIASFRAVNKLAMAMCKRQPGQIMAQFFATRGELFWLHRYRKERREDSSHPITFFIPRCLKKYLLDLNDTHKYS